MLAPNYDHAAAATATIAAAPATASAVNGDRPAAAIRQAYQRRVEALREYGAEEGVAVNAASERDFWAFIGTMPSARAAGVVLTPDGNLRAVWDDDNDDDSHFAVQFLGGGQVQYVVFRRRPAARKVSRAAGTDTLDGVKRQIDAFDLGCLVYL